MKYLISILFIIGLIISNVSVSKAQVPTPIPNEISGATCPTDPTQCWGYKLRQDLNNRFNGNVSVAPAVVSAPFANLPAPSLSTGKFFWCPDCQQTNICVGGGTGAWAFDVNTTWQCNTSFNSIASQIQFSGFLFANINTTLTTNGQLGYCSDCQIANPCTGGGSGAFAKHLNGVNVCN